MNIVINIILTRLRWFDSHKDIGFVSNKLVSIRTLLKYELRKGSQINLAQIKVNVDKS